MFIWWDLSHQSPHFLQTAASGQFYCSADRLALALVACYMEFKWTNFTVTVTTSRGLRMCVFSIPATFWTAIKGLESLGIPSSTYPWVQHRESFYSALLSEKGLCRWARLQRSLTDKSWKNVLSVLHICHSGNTKEMEGGTCQVILLERFSNQLHLSRSYHGLVCTSVKSKSCFSSSAPI